MYQLSKQKIIIFLFSFLCFVIACSPIAKYKSDPQVLSWEKDIREFEKRDSTGNNQDKTPEQVADLCNHVEKAFR